MGKWLTLTSTRDVKVRVYFGPGGIVLYLRDSDGRGGQSTQLWTAGNAEFPLRTVIEMPEEIDRMLQ